jgi:hypothetical protein
MAFTTIFRMCLVRVLMRFERSTTDLKPTVASWNVTQANRRHFRSSRTFLKPFIIFLSTATPIWGQAATSQEAKGQIDHFWLAKVGTCAGQSYIGYDGGQIQHLLGATWSITPRNLSPADLSNGLQWEGQTRLEATQARYFTNGSWKPWAQGMGFGDFFVSVSKRNGSWSFSPSPSSAIGQMFALPCNRVPRDPTAAEVQHSQAAQQSKACSDALQSTYANSVSKFIEENDPSTCRDSAGRPLVIALVMSNGNWAGYVMMMLSNGKYDFRVQDQQGNPAVLYMLVRYRKDQEAKLSDSYLESYGLAIDRVIKAMQNRGIPLGSLMTPDGQHVNWDRVPHDYPGTRN